MWGLLGRSLLVFSQDKVHKQSLTGTCQKFPCDCRQTGDTTQRSFLPSSPSVSPASSRPLLFPHLRDAIVLLSQHRHLCEELSSITAWVSSSHSSKLSSQNPGKDLKHPPSTAGMMNQAVWKVSDENLKRLKPPCPHSAQKAPI